MNLSKYKEAMDQITIDTAQIENNIKKVINQKSAMRKQNSYMLNPKSFILNKKLIASIVLAVAIIVCFMSVPDFYNTEQAITMTVYAAENNEVELTEDFLNIKTEVTPLIGGYSKDNQGNVSNANINYNIKLRCEGQDIDTITYSCSDEVLKRGTELTKVPAYFVDNITMPLEEYLTLDIWDDERLLSVFYGEKDSQANIVKLIGSSYTVSYEEQMNIQYGLVVNAWVDENEDYHFEDFIIKVELKMKDGSTYQKELLVRSGEFAFTDLEIRILK